MGRANEHQDSVAEAMLNGRDFSPQDLEYREKYLALMEALFPVVDNSDIFTRIVIISNTLFGAERGALFWFDGGRFTRTPIMKSGVNLTEKEVFSPGSDQTSTWSSVHSKKETLLNRCSNLPSAQSSKNQKTGPPWGCR